jgi:hypothetical protein
MSWRGIKPCTSEKNLFWTLYAIETRRKNTQSKGWNQQSESCLLTYHKNGLVL